LQTSLYCFYVATIILTDIQIVSSN